LNECEAFFNAGENEEMAGAHFFCQLRLWKRAGEDDVLGGEGGEERADVVLNGSDYGEVFLWVLEACEGLKEVGDSFAEADLAGEENFEGVLWRVLGAGELVEADSVGDDVDFFFGDAHLKEGTFRDGGWDGDGVGGGVDLFFAEGDVGFGEGLRDAPPSILFGENVFLIALVG
jgi:hypothetical protein